MRIGTPLLEGSPWVSQPAKALFERQRRIPRESDGIVTAFYTDARGEAAEERFPAGDQFINSAQRENEY